METLADTDYVQIKLRSNKKHHFTGEKVVVHRRTGFVLFSGIVKVVCKGRGDDGDDLWDKVLPKMTATKYMLKKGNLLASSEALRIVLNEYKDTFKDSWGVLADDGFQQLTEDLKVVINGGIPEEAITIEENTPHVPLDYTSLLEAREENIKQNEKALRARDRLLETREAVIAAREKTMNEREEFFSIKETEILHKMTQYQNDLDTLHQRNKELDERSNDLQRFMDETLALAKQYTQGSGGNAGSSDKKNTPSKVHFNLQPQAATASPSRRQRSSSSASPSLSSKDSAVKALLMVKKVCLNCTSVSITGTCVARSGFVCYLVLTRVLSVTIILL